jgi:riboflavin kinase, archaea type
MNELDVLIYLGKLDAFSNQIPVTTSHIGRDLGESQQNVSRWLIKMEHEGLIYRKDGIKGYLVQITPQGEKMLQKIKNEIELALAKKSRIVMKGKVSTGMGDGKYYIGLERYASEIEKIFGFRPYPGTLNIKLTDMTDIRQKEKLVACGGTEIHGFTEGSRVFGALRCFKCNLSGKKCIITIPERSHHAFDILEIVSPVHLRKDLHVSDGDEVKIEIDLT